MSYVLSDYKLRSSLSFLLLNAFCIFSFSAAAADSPAAVPVSFVQGNDLIIHRHIQNRTPGVDHPDLLLQRFVQRLPYHRILVEEPPRQSRLGDQLGDRDLAYPLVSTKG